MDADTIYLGAFAGILLTLFGLNIALARFMRDRKFLAIDLIVAGIACFFVLDKNAMAGMLGLPQNKTWMLLGVCPLLLGSIAASGIIARVTEMKDASPRAHRFLSFMTAMQGLGVLAFAAPTVLGFAGPHGLDIAVEARLMPLGFAIVGGAIAAGWILPILMTPAQLGEWRSATMFGAILFSIFLATYALVSFRKLPLDESISNEMRLAVIGSLVCFALSVYRRAQFANMKYERSQAAKRERSHDWGEKQVSRQQINQAHLMQVLKREKELEAELRAREVEQMEALRAAKEAADEMAKNKAQFLAFMSHEIRTPLNGIMGMVRLLMSTDISEQQRDYIQTLNYSGDALLSLVNDTLDISKIEAGQLVLESIDFDLQRLVSSIIMLMSARASEKNLLIRNDIGGTVPRFIKGDPTRLRQILLNLINNAIKFTEEGGVTVAVRQLSSTGPAMNRLRFEVQDTGPGISEEGCSRLFKEYSQVDASTTRVYGGTGLGLSICKQLVGAMHGEIGVSSLINQGSTFWFVIDFEESAADNLGEMPSKTPGSPVLSAMVVEDNEIHQKVIGGYLRLDGHDVTLISNAEDALAEFERKHFDVLLMDVNLPGIDGNEATRRIRANPDRMKATVPIIAITGNTAPLDIDGCRVAGMDDFVGKPVDPDALRATVLATHTTWLERRGAEPGQPRPDAQKPAAVPPPLVPTAQSGAPGGSACRVLIVDDNEINQKVIAGFLAAGRHEVTIVSSGEKAVSLATNHEFDLILMDVTLPGIDGLEAARRIRALPNPALAKVPIAAITGNMGRDDIKACHEAGMGDFLGKPIDPAALDALVDRVRHSGRQAASAPPPSAPPRPAAPAPAAPAPVSLDDYLPAGSQDIQLLDTNVLSRLTKAFDAKALTSLIDDMLRETVPLIEGMAAALQVADMIALRSCAHTLKGMAMTLGVVGVGEIAADIESSIQRGESAEALEAMIRQIDEIFHASQGAIYQWRDRNLAEAR